LGLLPGSALTPGLIESIVLLGASLPFAQAADVLAHFTGVRVGADTVRRLTERVGAVHVDQETAAVAELERALPDEPRGPAVQVLSVDGAMVPLVGGEWREVKTLAVGEVVGPAEGARTVELSYFSRCTDATTFGHLATAETHRRGTRTAGTVVAPTDGAAWCQGFLDLHRPDAVRVLDFPHAAEHLGAVAQAAFGPGTAAASEWLGVQAHRLRHGQEDAVLAALAVLSTRMGLPPETRTAAEHTHTYFATRRDQIRYAQFAAMGYPIGSGCVESANKLVVEARLKGPGMHWTRANVNSLLALRCLLANGRWAEAWPAVWRAVCAAARARPAVPAAADPPGPAAPATPPDRATPAPAPPPRAKTIVNGRPTADHPWKRFSGHHAKS